MSSININPSIHATISNNNNILYNQKRYIDLIEYYSIRKQFSRIIPNYYMNFNKIKFIKNKKLISNNEEYNKLNEEIISMQKSIDVLKMKNQKKLDEIEGLRNLMRKIGNNKIFHKDKKIIINNYCNRERRNRQCSGNERKGSNGIFSISSNEMDGGLSSSLASSGLSSSKDDYGNYEEGIQSDKICLNNCNGNCNGICSFNSGEIIQHDLLQIQNN